MLKRIAIKDHLHEIRLISQRSIIAMVVMAILVIALIARLGYLQLAQNDMYATLSKKNWLDLGPLEPTRGLIYDRNGVLLAENIPVFSLDVIPYKITNIPKVLSELAKIIPLSDTDIAQFQKQLKQHRRFDEIPLKLRLSESDVAKFYENQYRFPGVLVKARLMRHYPLGDKFAHVLGYVGRINTDELNDIDPINYSGTNYIGKLGIEKFYEDELHGTVGYEQEENDVSGEAIRVLNEIRPVPGKNIYLTLDSGLQQIAEAALDGSRGSIVAIQPETGQVLAMVSEPSFDPNIFVNGISSGDYQILQSSNDRPLYDRSIRGLYPFASTIKPFLAIEGLDSGVTTADATIFDPGWFKLRNSSHIFHDWRHHGHGTVDLNKAITESCDTYFFDLSAKLGIQRIDTILTEFGFGTQTGIDLEDELPGNVASPEWKRKNRGQPWYEGDTVNSAIGQGLMQVTPLQLASGVATISTRGKRFTPYLLLGEQQPGKTFLSQAPTPAESVKLGSTKTWDTVIDAMESVMTSPQGTGRAHFGKVPYSIAAKTGTAQVYSLKVHSEVDLASQLGLPERLRDHSLFIAFAPVDHPKIAIAVIVENSLLASTVARKIMDYYLIPKTATPTNPNTVASNNDVNHKPT